MSAGRLLDEVLDWFDALGAAIVLVGIVVILFGRRLFA